MAERAQIEVKGVVQGVGFRPFVYALATGLGLTGFVTNTADGVIIDAEGERLPEFLSRLRDEAPPLSRVSGISVTSLPLLGREGFTIEASRDSLNAFTLVAPDAATCPDCLRELLDPADRRYLYPFINCTNCGPRYSITKRVPYDRPNTTMAAFAMCPLCAREYQDPSDRRFHAQPNACPVCGPRLEYREKGASQGVTGTEALLRAIQKLRAGGIVAIKGLGGFHLACDATNDASVRLLRERKRKNNKPFAVMCSNIDTIKRFAETGDREEQLLVTVARPIVLLRKRTGPTVSLVLSPAVAPHNRYIGCMLPYTPLHYLLFHTRETDVSGLTALVMTSGNLAEEPLVQDNEEAAARLSGIADAFLFHDRDIFMRVDDSVVRVAAGADGMEGEQASEKLMLVRRSRGFAPDPIKLDSDGPEVLGCGADLKNTFTLTKGSFAVPSQHIGDMENYETLRFFEECLNNLKQVYRAVPKAIAHDLHPGYLSTKWAMEQGRREETVCMAFQHHYAHIGSVMAEHALRGPVLGVAFDGTGYGTDGNLWGGEFLVAGIEGFERAGQLRYLPLPGGESAIREPWRTAVSAVLQAAPEDYLDHLRRLAIIDRYGWNEVEQVCRIAGIRELSPLSSGAGRLFDAVSAMIGLCDRNTFEGEAAMALEALVVDNVADAYPVVMEGDHEYTTVDTSELIRFVMRDLAGTVEREAIATKFHNSVAGIIVDVATRICRARDIGDVALSGGTFQNLYLVRKTTRMLEAQGMRVHWNRLMPPNDACISLGQAYLARERLKKGPAGA